MATRHRQHRDSGLHPGTYHVSPVQRLLETDPGAPGISDRRDPQLENRARRMRESQDLRLWGRTHQIQEVHVQFGECQVGVGIEESGQYCLSAAIDDFVTGQIRTNGGNVAVFDADVGPFQLGT